MVMSIEAFTAINLYFSLSKKESLSLDSIGQLKISDTALTKLLDKILYLFCSDAICFVSSGAVGHCSHAL